MQDSPHTGYQRSTPFLQRNLVRSVEKLAAMGNMPSSNRPSTGRDSTADEDSRPSKRRRMDSSEAASMAKDHSLADQLFLAHEVGSVQRALRVQVLQIVHKDAARIRISDPLALAKAASAPNQVAETKARCKLTLSHVSSSGESILHCHSQVCTLKTFDNQAVPHRNVRIWLPRPFHIPEDSIFVTRDDDDRYHLGDAYKVSVELEATGEGDWPPLDPASLLPSSPHPSSSELRRWVLAGELNQVFGKHRSTVPLRLKTPSSPARVTRYLIDIDARWSTGYEASAIRPLEKDVEPSITVYGDGPPLSPVYTAEAAPACSPTCTIGGASPAAARHGFADARSPLKNGVLNGVTLNVDDDDDMDGEVTPNRSLRTRNSINYNLKDLSRRAQGKEARNRKRKAFQDVEEGHVIYDVPAQTVQLTSYRCVSCGLSHPTLPLLQAHLKLQHTEYDFITQLSGKGAHIQVAHRYDHQGPDDGQFHLTSPVKPFNLDQFLQGDSSWIKLRSLLEPPADNKNKKAKKRNAAGASQAASEAADTTRQVKPKPKPKPKTLRVPFTKQPLYDPITRLPLEPGSEFVRPEIDDRWLVQWHREAIEDFSDIPPEEREFLTVWDEFMLSQRINSEVYLPQSWLAFVTAKADWLVVADSRMVEFGKHLTYLLTRHVLDDATIQQAFKVITAARDELEKSGGTRISGSFTQPPKPKSAAACQVCGRQVLGPRIIFCTKPVSFPVFPV